MAGREKQSLRQTGKQLEGRFVVSAPRRTSHRNSLPIEINTKGCTCPILLFCRSRTDS